MRTCAVRLADDAGVVRRAALALAFATMHLGCGKASELAGLDAAFEGRDGSEVLGVDAGRPDTGANDTGPGDEHGFHVRVPQLRTVPCTGPMCTDDTIELRDKDFVCTRDS